MTTETKTVTLPDFLTRKQIEEAKAIFDSEKDTRAVRRICDEVIAPNMVEIDRKIGQENDPMYLAYAAMHVFQRTMS